MAECNRYLTSGYIKLKLKDSYKDKLVPRTHHYTLDCLFKSIMNYACTRKAENFKDLLPADKVDIDKMTKKDVNTWYIHGAVNDTKKSAQVNAHAKVFANFLRKAISESVELQFADLIIALIVKLMDARFGRNAKLKNLNQDVLDKYESFRSNNPLWQRPICLPSELLTVFKYAGNEDHLDPRFAMPELTEDEDSQTCNLDESNCSEFSQVTIQEAYLPIAKKLEKEKEKKINLEKQKRQIEKDYDKVENDLEATNVVIEKLTATMQREHEDKEAALKMRQVFGDHEYKEKIIELSEILPIFEKIREKMGAASLVKMAKQAGTQYGIFEHGLPNLNDDQSEITEEEKESGSVYTSTPVRDDLLGKAVNSIMETDPNTPDDELVGAKANDDNSPLDGDETNTTEDEVVVVVLQDETNSPEEVVHADETNLQVTDETNTTDAIRLISNTYDSDDNDGDRISPKKKPRLESNEDSGQWENQLVFD